jgi:hypothetical protein
MPIAKRKKVEVYQHSTFRNVTVDIYLTKEMKFQAEFAGQKFEEVSGAALKQKLCTAINEANEIQWIHVMEIKHTNRTHGEHQHGLEIEIDHFWATAHQNNYWKANGAAYDYELNRDDPRFPDDRPFGLRLLGRAGMWRDHYSKPVTMENICTSRREEGSESGGIVLNDDELSIVLPFDQKLYDGVMGICQGIASANARIRQLLGTPEGLKLVANSPFTLMGGPTDANNTTNPAQHASENLPEPKGSARRRR